MSEIVNHDGEEVPAVPAVDEPEGLAAEAAAANAAATLARIEDALGALGRSVEALGERTARLEEAAEATARQVGFLPPQVRRLDGKIDGLGATVSEPRLRLALLGLLAIYDLVEQMAGGAAPDAGSHPPGAVLRTQLRQVLAENGVSEIPAEGAFDPQLHRALDSVAVDDPARDGHIVAVVRPGFRSGRSVLRYAEVAVGRHVPTPPAADGGATATVDAGDLPLEPERRS